MDTNIKSNTHGKMMVLFITICLTSPVVIYFAFPALFVMLAKYVFAAAVAVYGYTLITAFIKD
jgi:hypothetical protein